MILLMFLAVILIALALRLAVPALRRHRMAAELRGDWWPQFEREFRSYASRARNTARGADQAS
jgi:hypothetical protein